MEAAGQLSLGPLADSALESAPAPKRRKLRKGTQSCWECKRRKARCTFASTNQDICEGCTRRGTDCVSQEVTDQPPPPGSNKHLVDRLGQVEALVKQLLQASHGNGPHADNGLPGQTRPGIQAWSQRRTMSHSGSPVALMSDTSITTSSSSDASQVQRRQSVSCSQSRSQISSPTKAAPSTAIRVEKDTSIPETYDDVPKRLLEAWPSQEDMDIILAIPVETSQIIRAVICTRTSSTRTSLPSSATLLERPPPGSHPALIARSLLVLASFLQGMPFSSAHHLEKLSTPWQELMSRAVKTAHNLVTCNDELIASLEGIECIMLEGLYENYAGNLRPSWLAARRSVAIAQMLGLNRGVKPKSLTASVIEPSDLWFRLVQFDRYLSLMLGLPQSSLEDTYVRPDALEGCTPLDRFLRFCTVACGRLLQRDPSSVYDSEVNKEIDKLLQEASALMPAQWWVAPSLTSDTGPVERIRETLRFNDHFMYYHLLLQLHFPNVLQPISECGCIYHRMTAITASREILSRMMSFRATRPARYYCRGTDLIAFFSSTALSLAHICDTPQDVTAQHGFHFLAHQRLSDRGLLEQTLAIMQELVDRNNDEIATRVASLLNYLLAIEEDAASGGKYVVAFSSETQGHDDLGYRVKMSDDGTTLKIYLPHFWAIKIRRQGSQGERLPIGNSAHGCNGSQLQIESSTTQDENISLVTSGQSRLSTFSAPGNADGLGIKNSDVGGQALFEREAYEADWALENLDFTFLDSFIEGTLEQNISGSQGT
ncbi:zn 2cys6 transcription factor [Colletotrichum incanum]|uniref:Zn 2cys6 transcription factor n=1 Tax=Colletotrichum incanum TaxID=1573173 RepID=A0A161VE50_COLIC|nr:zn 2cys6 transcription factor [Colletotrichum incanum]